MKIFISYRRSETPHEAHRIRQLLQQCFGGDSVFIDRKIPPGQEFDKYLETELKNCDALVAVMGKDFFRTRKNKKLAEAAEEIDYVRWEIETALHLGIPVFPILTAGSHKMPSGKDLPEKLRGFSKKQALYAVDPAFDSAIDQLATELKTIRIVSRQDDLQTIGDATITQVRSASKGGGSSLVANVTFKHALAIATALAVLGAIIDHIAGGTGAELSKIPRYLIVGLVFVATTVSITFCPIWIYELTSIARARHHLDVGSIKSVVVTCSASSLWILNAVFLSLATSRGFEYFTFFNLKLPVWQYILLGLLQCLTLAFLSAWEVALNAKRTSSLELGLIYSFHFVNFLCQITALVYLLRHVSDGNTTVLNGFALFLTACACGMATFWINSTWSRFFHSQGRKELTSMVGTLVAAWVFLTMAAYAYSFVPKLF